MKNLLIAITLMFFIGGCAPTAQFIKYDVYAHYPIIYNEDGVKELPPDVLAEGESWVWRIGNVERTYRPRKKFEYKSAIIITGDRGYEYTYSVCGKVDVRNGTRSYHLRENVDGEIRHYLIIGTNRYRL